MMIAFSDFWIHPWNLCLFFLFELPLLSFFLLILHQMLSKYLQDRDLYTEIILQERIFADTKKNFTRIRQQKIFTMHEKSINYKMNGEWCNKTKNLWCVYRKRKVTGKKNRRVINGNECAFRMCTLRCDLNFGNLLLLSCCREWSSN